MSEFDERRTEGDLAGREFWEDVWADSELPPRVRTDGTSARDDAFIVELDRALADYTGAKRVVEVGCARSVWLSHLASSHGLEVSGLDYSPEGCELCRRVLARDGVEGDVRCADLFAPPDDFVRAFDVGISFGVVEHFERTRDAVAAVANLVTPGGIVVTEVPNLAGLAGAVLRRANPTLYAAHRVLDRAALRRAHEDAGLEVLRCDYVMSTGFSAVTVQPSQTSGVSAKFWPRAVSALHRLSDLVRRIERRTGTFPRTRVLAPFVWCVARVPVTEAEVSRSQADCEPAQRV